MATYHLYLVDSAGAQLHDLTAKADWGGEDAGIADELNAPGGISFKLPIRDALVPYVTRFHEVQAWRDSTLLKWAVVTRRSASRSTFDVQAAGLWWYFKHRYVGRAGRVNYVTNGDFETGDLTGWSASGVTASVVTSHHTDGTYGAELIQANPDVDTYINQQFAAVAGDYFTFTGRIHIYADQPYAGPAFENRGLFVLLIYPGAVVQAVANAAIDESHVPGQTYQLKVGISVPADAPVGTVLEVRLMAPGGYIMWDSVRATIMESLSYPLTDVAAIANALIVHGQDPSFGKSDLQIAATTTLAGIIQSRFFQFADHQEIAASVEEMAHAGLFDFDIVQTGAVGAMLRAFQTYSPAKGSYKPSLPLTLTQSSGDTCFDFTIDDDGEQTATSVLALGDGDGPDREEGSAVDASDLGGLILERIINANPGTPIDALGPIAAEELRAARKGAIVGTFTVKPGSAHITGLVVGDTTDATVAMGPGYSFPSATVRVVRKVINPKNDTAAFSVNLA